MAITKKPPVPPSKPKKPEKPPTAPEVVELSLDDLSEDKPSTLMGVPMLPQVDVPVPAAKPAPADKPAAAEKPAVASKPAPVAETPVASAPPADEAAKTAAPLKTLVGVPALEPPRAGSSEAPKEAAAASAAANVAAMDPAESSESGDPPAMPAPAASTEPASTEPASTEPASTEPASTEPASTEPASTEPASTEPKETMSSEPPAPLAIERSRLPEPLRAIVDGPRPRLIAFATAAGLVLLVFIGVVVRALSSSPETDTTTTTRAASASATTSSAPVVSSAPVASAAPSATPPASPVACVVSGEARVVAPRAVVASGIEVVALDSTIGVGFAKTASSAMTIELDPTTMSATNAQSADSREPIKRVTPMASGKMAIDVDGKADPIHGRRLVAQYDVGAKAGALVWAPHASSSTKTLWKLDGNAPVESTRGVVIDGGVALAFRYDGAIWAGLAKGADLAPSPPVHVAGLGPQLGSPAIAAAGGKVIVAWADRADKSAPWGLRSFVWSEGTEPVAQPFTPPTGGLGENVMSPSLTALSDGSFLLVWTEGPMAQQQVRARVLANDGTPRGGSIEVSGAGVHAGQGRAAVLADGRGVIAFLSAVGTAFEVRAIGMRCAPTP